MTDKEKSTAKFDPNITPSDVASRMEREGENFKSTPEKEGDMDTTKGYSVDREGRLNNFAIEPEMYVNEPGDLREKEEQIADQRGETVKEVNQTDEEGKLKMSEDNRGKGTGII
ncbi:MAG: hypothetical protein WBA93_16310 [Microcoleaceae cyanobacterium]